MSHVGNQESAKGVRHTRRERQTRPERRGPVRRSGGAGGPLWGERRGQDHPAQVRPGPAGIRGDHHPGRGAGDPGEHRPPLLRHLRALLLPPSHPGGPPGLLPGALPPLAGEAVPGPDGLLPAAHEQGPQELLHRPKEPVRGDPGPVPGGGLHPHGRALCGQRRVQPGGLLQGPAGHPGAHGDRGALHPPAGGGGALRGPGGAAAGRRGGGGHVRAGAGGAGHGSDGLCQVHLWL